MFNFIFSLAKLNYYRFLYFNRFKSPIIMKTLYLPWIKIRRNGKISIGNTKFRRQVSFFCDGGDLKINDHVFFNNGCSISCQDKIHIGSHTLFGESVKVYDHNHAVINGRVSHDKFDTGSVYIGNHCWIGSNVIILPGVNICDDVIIGAGSVVSRSISEPGVYGMKDISLRKIK